MGRGSPTLNGRHDKVLLLGYEAEEDAPVADATAKHKLLPLEVFDVSLERI
jgi:hypothetical protein